MDCRDEARNGLQSGVLNTFQRRGMGLFNYDAFLSHRAGDNAGNLYRELVAHGCNVWFDNDLPLTDRRLLGAIRAGFAASRTVLVFLSREFAPSAWTILEIKAALSRERKCEAPSLLFCLEDGAVLDRVALPPEIKTVAQDRLWRESPSALAGELLARNGYSKPPGRGGETISRKRSFARLERIAVNLPGNNRIDELRRECLLRLAGDDFDSPESSAVLMAIRGLEQAHAPPGEGLVRDALRALGVCFGNSPNIDDRANALYILHGLATIGDERAIRLLRRALSAETSWAVARLFHSDDREAQRWWPKRLRGIEESLLMRQGRPDESLVPFLAPGVRLALAPADDLRIDDLPVEYRVEVSAHWIFMLAGEVRRAYREAESGLQPVPHIPGLIDAELSFREMHEHIALLLGSESPGTEKAARALLVTAKAVEEIVATSESCSGAPLSSFGMYFVDHLLPILAVLVLILDQQQGRTLGQRAVAAIAPFVPEKETKAYAALLEDSWEWRREHGTLLSPEAPVRVNAGSKRIQIRSKSFQRLWMHSHAS